MSAGAFVLHGYWRSSASYRVRIALNLKGLPYEQRSLDLRTGAHKQADPQDAGQNVEEAQPEIDVAALHLLRVEAEHHGDQQHHAERECEVQVAQYLAHRFPLFISVVAP